MALSFVPKKDEKLVKNLTYEDKLANKTGITTFAADQVVDEEVRLQLNGESEAQMAWARAVKSAGGVTLNPADGNDTSRDSKVEYDTSVWAKLTDAYVLVTTIMFLGVKIPMLAPLMMLFHLPPMFVCRLYMSVLPDNTQRVTRSYAFYLIFALTLWLAIPAMMLVLFSMFLDYIFYWIFGITYCSWTFGWLRAWKSMRKIDPFRNGPSIILHLPDFFVCLIGQCARQTVFETLYMVSCMWLLMPWLKYYINCNPWIYDLDQRLCQQITTTMKDCGTPQEVSSSARDIISMCRQPRDMAETLDKWSFVPHYPYPPLDRRYALGLQAGGGQYPAKFTLFVHVTHAVAEAQGSMEQFVLSNSVAEPIYRVMLWYNNPFHFLTGWVEASVSTGLPSQPEKHHGGEHPMWLVTARTPMIAGRDAFTGSGMIDAFFDFWLPVFVYEMRIISRLKYHRATLNEARQYAEDNYEEVISKDGVSKPKGLIGRKNYNGQDTLSKFDDIARGQCKDITQMLGRKLAEIADTTVGMKISEFLQSSRVQTICEDDEDKKSR